MGDLGDFARRLSRAGTAAADSTKNPTNNKPTKRRRALGIMALEPRIMFDAAAATTAADVTNHADAAADHAAVAAAEQAAPQPAHQEAAHQAAASPGTSNDHDINPASVEAATAPVVRDLVIIDSAVPDAQTLIAGLKEGSRAFILDSSRDGLAQIAEIIDANGLHDLSSIQILSHGREGQVRVGSTTLTAADLPGHADALAAIGASLAADGDILLYGCDVGANPAGAQFLNDLARLTGADVAASTDLTGAAARGGDWTLEASSGQIEAGLPIAAAALDSYDHLLIGTSTRYADNTLVVLDGSFAETSIVVSGADPYLYDLNVQTFIQHPAAGDLRIRITSPSGTSVTLTDRNGGSNANVFNGTIWDDSANPGGQVPYASNNGLVTDQVYANNVVVPRLVPQGALGAFIGENPNGTWRIQVDKIGSSVGTLNGWSLDLTTLPEAPPKLSQTFGNTTPIAINNNTVIASSIFVSGARNAVLDLDVQTFVRANLPADMIMTLTSPSGTVVTLTSQNGLASSSDLTSSFNGTIWNDDGAKLAASTLSYTSGQVATSLIPEEAMAAFVGENPNGTWTLRVSSQSNNPSAFSGTLDQWSLTLDSYSPPNGTAWVVGTSTATVVYTAPPSSLLTGADASAFAINDQTGAITFLSVPTTPRLYTFNITSGTETQQVSINVTPALSTVSNVSPFDNNQASLALSQLVVEQGVFPSRGSSSAESVGVPIGSIRSFAGNYAPSGTEVAQGQLRSIAQNTALFSLLGAYYGGDGQSTFALPNLGHQTIIGTGTGVDGIAHDVAATEGSDSVTLAQENWPGTAPFDNDQPSLAVNYVIQISGTFNTGLLSDIGLIFPFLGTFAPDGFAFADGRLLSIAANQTLYSVLGGPTFGGDGVTTFALPDLRGRSIIGASSSLPLGTVVGQSEVTVTNSNLPSGNPVDNRQPSLALNYLVATGGDFPSRNGGSPDPATPMLGEVVASASASYLLPNGWARADGQLMGIAQNTALFAVLETNFGGNGTTTFALPDLQNRIAVGTGTDLEGQSADYAGAQYGSNSINLSNAQVPTPLVTTQSSALAFGGDVDNDGVIDPGDTVTTTVRVNNISSVAVANVTLVESLSGLTLVPNSASLTINGSTQSGLSDLSSLSLGTLAAHGFVTLTFNATVNDQANQRISNPYAYGQAGAALPSREVAIGYNDIALDSLTLGDRVYNDANRNGTFDSGEAGIASVSLSLFADANNDDIADSASALATTTTNGSGFYAFTGLARGNYLVRVNASNFTGGPLATFAPSQNVASDPDANVDNDNDAQPISNGVVLTRSITLAFNSEPASGAGNDTNNTLDLGFFQNVPPALDLDASGAGTGFTTTFTEHGAAVALADTDVSVSDTDDTRLKSATITNTNFQSGQDTLSFTANATAMGDIALASNNNQVLTLTSAAGATMAQWQAALQAVKYANTSSNPVTTDRNITVTVSDGQAANAISNTATAVVHITPVNDAPVITSAASASVNEAVAANTIVYTAAATDPENGAVTYAISGADASAFTINSSTGAVTVNASPDFETKALYNLTVTATDPSANFSAQAVTINVSNLAPVISSGGAAASVNEGAAAGTVVYTAAAADPAGGAVTYSLVAGGDAAAFSINASTGAVTINNAPDFETKNSYSFTVQASDGALVSTKAVTLSVNNLAPVISSGAAVTVNEGVAAGTIVYTAAAVDPAGGAVTYSLVAGGDAAAFSINASTGAVTINTAPDFETRSSYGFTVRASDGTLASTKAVTLTVNNLAPVITSGATASVNESVAAGAIVYTAAAADPAGGAVTYSLVAGGDATAFAINASTGAVTINAMPDFETKSSYSFTVRASDATLVSTQAVTLTVINVAPVIVSAATANVNENVAAGTAVYTAVAADPAGSTVTYSLVAGGDAAAFSINSSTGAVTINNSPDFETKSSYNVTVRASDSSEASSTQTVTVNVTDINDAPVSTNDTVTTSEDTIVVLAAGDFGSYSDVENNPLASIRITTLASNGSLQFDTTGAGVWAAVTLNQEIAAAQIAAGRLRFVPDANENGTPYATIRFQVSDGTDLSAAAYTLTVNVTAVNDAPTATAGGTAAYTEQAAAVVVDNTVTVTDIDSPNLTGATVTISTGLQAGDRLNFATQNGITGVYSSGALTLSGTATLAQYEAALRSVTFDNPSNDNPTNAGNSTSRTVTWVVNDGAVSQNLSAGVTSTIAITAVNDAPVLDSSKGPVLTAVNEDNGAPVNGSAAGSTLVSTLVNLDPPAGGLDNVTEPDGNATTGIAITAADAANGTWFYSLNASTNWQAVGTVGEGTALLLAADANTRLYFQANADFNGSAGITVRAWDQSNGSAQAGSKVDVISNGVTTPYSAATDTTTITVNAVTDIADDIATTTEDTAVTTNVLTNDTFEGTAVVTAVTNGTNGTVVNNGNGTVTYTPKADFNGTDSYTYTVTSGGVIETATVSVTVGAVVDIANDIATTTEDTAVTTNVLANDTFEGNPVLTAVTNGANGTVVNNGDGTLTYTPKADFNGTDSYTYTVTSGGVTEQATVTVTVNAVVDIANDSATTNEDTAVTTNVLANDTFEGTSVVTGVTNGANGTVVNNGDGTVTYPRMAHPSAGFSDASPAPARSRRASACRRTIRADRPFQSLSARPERASRPPGPWPRRAVSWRASAAASRSSACWPRASALRPGTRSRDPALDRRPRCKPKSATRWCRRSACRDRR